MLVCVVQNFTENDFAKFLINHFLFSPLFFISLRKNVGASAISSALNAHAGNLNGNVSTCRIGSLKKAGGNLRVVFAFHGKQE